MYRFYKFFLSNFRKASTNPWQETFYNQGWTHSVSWSRDPPTSKIYFIYLFSFLVKPSASFFFEVCRTEKKNSVSKLKNQNPSLGKSKPILFNFSFLLLSVVDFDMFECLWVIFYGRLGWPYVRVGDGRSSPPYIEASRLLKFLNPWAIIERKIWRIHLYVTATILESSTRIPYNWFME